MSNPRYPEEFKIQAVNQVTEKKLPVADVAVCWASRLTACSASTGRSCSGSGWRRAPSGWITHRRLSSLTAVATTKSTTAFPHYTARAA